RRSLSGSLRTSVPALCMRPRLSMQRRTRYTSTSPAFARGSALPGGFAPPADFSLARGVRRLVLTRLRAIGYGQTATYAAIAVAAGNPKAVRAVGTACATNPIPVVVPCHRVVRSDDSIGQYVGGVDAKKTLLILEGRPAD